MANAETIASKVFGKDSVFYNDFIKFSQAIDDAKATFGYSEDEAINFIAEKWKFPEDADTSTINPILLNAKVPSDLDDLFN